jgi:hypothetical protein
MPPNDSPTPAAVVAPAVLPDGNHEYSSPGRGRRTNWDKVTVYRKNGVIVVSYTTSTTVDQWVRQANGAMQLSPQGASQVCDITMSALLTPVGYSFTVVQGFQRQITFANFNGTKVTEGGFRGRPSGADLIPPSTAWVTFSVSDFGSYFALPVELRNFTSGSVSAFDLDYTRPVLYSVDRPADLARPDGVPAADLPLHLASGKFEITEWYDPVSFMPDIITTKPGTTYKRKVDQE